MGRESEDPRGLRERLALPCCFFFLVAAAVSGQSFPKPGSIGDDPLGAAEGAGPIAAGVDPDLARSAPENPAVMPAGAAGASNGNAATVALEDAEYSDCEPAAPLISFKHGYAVGMCIEYLDKGVGPIVKADARDYGLDSRESGLLYFFDRDNAEVLIKVLDACHVNEHYWVFVAPVTTLAFNLYVEETATRKRWTHRNPKGGRTATTKSDVTAFPCSGAGSSTSMAGGGNGVHGVEPVHAGLAPAAAPPVYSARAVSPPRSPAVVSAPIRGGEGTDCVPRPVRGLSLRGGYRVKMCVEYLKDGEPTVVGARDYGLESEQSAILYFFERNNAEVLIKVLDGCGVNGRRWVFVAPVTSLAFNLAVESPDGAEVWTHRNRLNRTAAAASDIEAFACSQPPPPPPPRDVPPPPPPLGADPPNLSALADAFRTREFANNPSLHEMNAHWAYARGVTGEGETIAMTDTGLYATHVDLRGQLHGETLYTVISDDVYGPGWYDYHKVAGRAPETAYPSVTRDTGEPCHSTGRQCHKFAAYDHGTAMAAVAVAARESGTDHLRHAAHGLAFNARLRFLPTLRYDVYPEPYWGSFWYWFEGGILEGARREDYITRHDLVRRLGDAAPVVSNAWLTGHSNFILPDSRPWSGYRPFHWALGPNYAGYQSDRDVGDRAVLVWSACNIPSTDGPKCGEAALPSISERQLRAATGGGAGLADVVLTDAQRGGLSAAEALRRAEAVVAAWRKHWLAVTSVFDADFDHDRPVDCALKDSLRRRSARECAIDYTMRETSRCGFASDWCMAAGSAWANMVLAAGGHVPDPEAGYVLDEYKTSPATAAASAAFALLLEAYRGADGALTVGTHKVLERLKLTANTDIFDYRAAHGPDGRGIVQLEEEQIRALIGIAGATDDDLRDLVRDARADFTDLLPEIPREDLTKEETRGENDDFGSFTSEERRLIAAAKNGLSDAQWDRFHLLSRVSDYFSSSWRRIDTFAPQLSRIKKLLDETGPNDYPDGARANDLLARLIRQVEWIDEQLRRIDRTKYSLTDAEIRRITVTSMIGHGLIDLKAATDPAR